MQRLDSQGNMDFCREKFTPVSPEAAELVRKIKLGTNALMAIIHKEYQASSHPDIRRMLYEGLTGFEDASMWAVKGLTSEHRFDRSQAPQAPQAPQTAMEP